MSHKSQRAGGGHRDAADGLRLPAEIGIGDMGAKNHNTVGFYMYIEPDGSVALR